MDLLQPQAAPKRDPPGSAGVPPAQGLARPWPSPPLGSTGNGAMALLRPGRCGSRRKGGCLQHCTEAQRQPMGQHAGGTPALPGKAVPADRVAACGIALKLSGGHRDSMRSGRPRSRARPAPQTGWLPAALHWSSAAAKGTACGRDARAPGQGKNREHGLHLSTMHYSFPSWFFVPLRGYLFLSEARPSYFSPDGTRRMRGERLKEP